jgi:hypothetical protein
MRASWRNAAARLGNLANTYERVEGIMRRWHRLGRKGARLSVAIAVVASTSVLSVGPALADTFTPPPGEIPPKETDFTDPIGVQQFDPALGTLNSMTISLTATVTGEMGYENTSTTSGSDGTIEMNAQVSVWLASDPASVITVASPTSSEAFSLAVFDGIIDFGGTSGVFFADINETDTVTATLTDPAALAAATGTGTLDFEVEAVGTTAFTGSSGNESTRFGLLAGATVTVTYDYQPPVEPAIDIEKATNGEDADTPEDAVSLLVGDAITWEYVVTNTGNVDLTNVVVTDDQGVAVSCPQDTLVVAESMTCTGTGVAVQGSYANVGTVTGTAPDESTVSDSDPSHYITVIVGQLAIMIDKTPDLQSLVLEAVGVGKTATWTITVTVPDTSVDLVNVEVTDPEAPNCDRVIGDLAAGETFQYTCTRANVTDGFTNVATVTGEDGAGGSARDDDDAVVEVRIVDTGAESSQELLIFGLLLLGAGVLLVASRSERRKG